MSSRTTLAISLTLAVWLSTVIAVAATGIRPYDPGAGVEMLHPVAMPVDLDACAHGACF